MKLTEEKLRNDLVQRLPNDYIKIISFNISESDEIRIILEAGNSVKYFIIIENDKLEYYSNTDHSVGKFDYSKMLELAVAVGNY